VKSQREDCLVVMFDRIGPYHFARLRTIGKLISTVAIEMTATDKTYNWDLVAGAENFERITLFNPGNPGLMTAGEVRRRVRATLEKCRPLAVAVPGWSDRGALIALEWCASNSVPAIVMSDSTVWDYERFFWKERIKRQLLRLAGAAFVAGTPHAEYLQNLGMVPDRVFLGYDVVDNDHFRQGADAARRQDVELRKKHALPQNYFLASARFVEKKNLARLINAYATYRARSSNPGNGKSPAAVWELVLLGDGPLRPALYSQIAALGLKEHVFMQGFKQYAELPVFYGLARAFIHASTTEQWGLVVNEAMASGLPVLVSNRCGCALDLVREASTGFVFDPFNTEQMADLMSRCSAKPGDLVGMGKAAQTLISNWGLDRFAKGLMQAVEKVLKSQPPKASLRGRFLIKLLLRLNGEGK
jgi:1,2-diacylglycerol 3-alpha-glucosyltransferase